MIGTLKRKQASLPGFAILWLYSIAFNREHESEYKTPTPPSIPPLARDRLTSSTPCLEVPHCVKTPHTSHAGNYHSTLENRLSRLGDDSRRMPGSMPEKSELDQRRWASSRERKSCKLLISQPRRVLAITPVEPPVAGSRHPLGVLAVPTGSRCCGSAESRATRRSWLLARNRKRQQPVSRPSRVG